MSTEAKHARARQADETLSRFWRYVYYEHEMLEATGRWLVENLDTRTGDYEFPIHMESFLIHARNLNEFYYATAMAAEDPRKQPRDDDIIADDYCEGVAWNPPPENRLPDALISRINKRLAHLTCERAIGNRMDYDYAEILRKLESTREAFVEAVPSSRLDIPKFNPWYLPQIFWEEHDEPC